LLVINPQVLNEYAYNVLRKMPRVGHEQLLADLESMRTWCVASVTADTAAQAVVITRRFRFSFYDAALLASAISHGCDTFLSEDMSHQQRVGELRIVDPFQSDFASVVGR